MGVGALIFHTVENPHVMIVGPPYSQFSVSVNSINHGPCSTVVFTIKKFACNWTQEVQTCIVQGPTVFLNKAR